jgi:hypothetical protein
MNLKNTLLTLTMTAAAVLSGMVPRAKADDSFSFEMVPAAGATCLASNAHGRVTISNLGSVQHMHVEVVGLTPNNDFTLFITQHSARPFGFSWYQGEIRTDRRGRGVGDFVGIFSDETFTLTDTNTPVQMSHVAMWFADANDAANPGCPAISTPFDGDHQAGILVLSTANFPDDQGPLQHAGQAD